MLHFVGLGEERYREVQTFSTGMRQRFKLAASLVHDPDLLFLDEPTNGLDPRGRTRMLDLIERVCKEHGIHLILASHLLPDVERLCDQVWVLDQGEMKKSERMETLTAAARGAKRVRVERSQVAAFTAAVSASGLHLGTGRSDTEFVLSRGEEADVDSEEVFALAANAGVRLLAVQAAARSLEDAFLEALTAEAP